MSSLLPSQYLHHSYLLYHHHASMEKLEKPTSAGEAFLHLVAAPPSRAPPFCSLGNQSQWHSAQTGLCDYKATKAAPETERKGWVCVRWPLSVNLVSQAEACKWGYPSKPREAIPTGITSLQAPAGKGEGAGPVTCAQKAVAADTSQLPPPSFQAAYSCSCL